jgi:FixJ family two-component response regulator
MDRSFSPGTRVAVVDDDPAFRTGLVMMLERHGLLVEAFPSAFAYLEHRKGGEPDCLILDLDLPGLSGLELQDLLAGSGSRLPVVFVSGHADVPASVRAMRQGAVDFLQKPFPQAALLRAVAEALARVEKERAARVLHQDADARIAGLTERERRVCELAVQGLTNGEIGALLGANENTVKSLRKRAMDRLGVDSLPDLVRLFDRRTGTPAG